MLARLAAAFVIFLCGALQAGAESITLGQTVVSLTTPPGQCALQRAQAGEARLIKVIEDLLPKTNRLVAAFADCRQLSDWRAGKRKLLDDTAQYQTVISAESGPPEPDPGQALKQVCAGLRAEGDRAMSSLTPDLNARIEQVMRAVKVSQTRFLGVIAEEADACYAAVAQRFKTEAGTDKTQIALFAAAFPRGKLIFYYLYAPYRSGDTVTAMLAKHKANVAALLAANKP
ncbi:MAG: hypothetical protein F9K29_15985 [Hyphomicrobiaceae bacterium]|nr:MAG: hypothetical protein F9K29_15985 [Hyphomicrobiaceae bacterium]